MIPGKIFTGFAEFKGRRNTRYNTKTMTKTKKALSLLETVHERADCSKYANALGTDDNDVPSVTSSTIVSHVSPVCSVFVECAKCISQAVARGTVAEYAHNCITSYKVEQLITSLHNLYKNTSAPTLLAVSSSAHTAGTDIVCLCRFL